MNIPNFFDHLLRMGGNGLSDPVLKNIESFEMWLEHSNQVFFPEYTDHGKEHVQNVVNSAEWLLTESARKALKPSDAAVLLLSVLLHDCGMRLSKDGFLQLVDPKSKWPPKTSRFLDKIQDRPWTDLWSDFLREASRWDDQKLVDLFGNQAEPIKEPAKAGKWDEQDLLLIGEFLRRHHPRLAHEIAICGVPGPGDERLAFEGLEEWLVDLVGLVARSHGLKLRSAVDLVAEEMNEPPNPYVNVPLLMSLLRIADYIQIDASRAPAILKKTRRLLSRVSGQAWEMHDATHPLVIDQEVDPEAGRVEAEPKSLRTFIGLQELFADIQQELDASWVVIGEVYKGDPHHALRIRRIRSNLDDVDAFAKQAAFVPVRARFDSAGGHLLKLMVGPFYDDEPAYGVRELIQNAVDACREFEDVLGEQSRDLDRPQLKADVVVTVDEGERKITVEDCGIGMNADVIVNYFLKAGASFRDSDEWHKRHDDRDGASRVPRSGRFGLGVLATFLLGDEVEVTTRHADDLPERGIKFKAKLDDPLIQLNWHTRLVGTTITVKSVRPEVFDRLANAKSWDWYTLQKPSVLRVMQLTKKRDERPSTIQPGQMVELKNGEIVPHGDKPLSAPWRHLQRSGFKEILWSLQTESGWADVANGILLQTPEHGGANWRVLWPDQADDSWRGTGRSDDWRADFFLYRPRIAVIEGTSLLPVDLKRTNTVGLLPFHNDLIAAVCRDVLASLLVRTKARREDVLRQFNNDWRNFTSFATLWHPAVSTNPYAHSTSLGNERQASWLFVTEKGLTLEDPSLKTEHTRLGVAFIVFLEQTSHDAGAPNDEMLQMAFRRIPAGFPLGTQLNFGFYKPIEAYRQSGGYASAIILVPTTQWQAEKNKLGFQGVEQSDIENGWTIVWTGDDPRPREILNKLTSEAPKKREPTYVLLLLPEDYKPQEPRNPLSILWQDLFYHGEIPYDRGLRKQMLARAFDELQEDIELWTKLEFAEDEDKLAHARYWIDSGWITSSDKKMEAP